MVLFLLIFIVLSRLIHWTIYCFAVRECNLILPPIPVGKMDQVYQQFVVNLITALKEQEVDEDLCDKKNQCITACEFLEVRASLFMASLQL